MIRYFIEQIKHKIVSLRFSILSIFVTLFIFTTLMIIAITSIRFYETLSITTLSLMKHASNNVLYQLHAGIKPAAMESDFSAHLIEQNVLKPDETDLVPYTYNLLQNLPLALSVFWSDEQGNFIYAAKEKDGSITTETYNRKQIPTTHTIIYRDIHGKIIKHVASTEISYDPRTRPTYLNVKQKKHRIWTNVYLLVHSKQLGVTSASPVYKNGKFIGMFGIGIGLNYLSNFMTNQKISAHGYSFIISESENLIAYPQRDPFNKFISKPYQLINTHKVSMPLIDASLDFYKKTGQEEIKIKYRGHSYLVFYRPIKDLAEYNWLIGVVVPENDFLHTLRRINLITLSISALVLLFGIILVSNLTTRIIKPIKTLVKETNKIKNFELDSEINIKSRIKEVIDLRDAIKAMKTGLKSFQKYVPKILVRQLIESGEDLRIGGTRRQITAMFTDVKGFTTIAEEMDPDQLMVQLCEYFEVLSRIIISTKGTIDKYIGDALMAFWGAPIADDESCYHAAIAALQCQTKLDELNSAWKKQNKPQLETCIGINMGEAIVGNLGSSERLNYTALGDTINLTSRLEKINRTYKTRILVSEVVYENIKDNFILRMVDCVAVRGRAKGTLIYELLSQDITTIPFDIHPYNIEFGKGFTAYKQKQWDEAIAHFKNCLNLYSADTIAPIFIERCEKFTLTPPPDNWQGVFVGK